MGQALYRKHRPKKLAEIVGQEHIAQTLEQALKQGRISHAYLFTGPRGVGKTSIARILAHEVNKLPYSDDSAHMDIIEIDAASNRRIDEIRELREKAYVAPTSAQYKVYIIDEVHMLTREAFNALLKLLEEPPAHVIFILATTDAHKLPDTIVSRTQRFSFKPVDKAQVVNHLKDIAKQEKITVSDEALELLAEHGEGSFRDSISLLDQARNQGQKLEAGDVQRLLGIPPAGAVDDLLRSVSNGEPVVQVMGTLKGLYDQGYTAAAIAKKLGQILRRQLTSGQATLSTARTLQLLSQLIEVPSSHDPERFLEITLLQARPVTETTQLNAAVTLNENTEPPEVSIHVETVPEPPLEEPPAETAAPVVPEITKKTARKKSTSSTSVDAALWPEVLNALKQKHNTLYSVVRMAEPVFLDDGTVQLNFAFAFHQKRIDEETNRRTLTDIIHHLTGQAVTIHTVLDKNTANNKPSPAPELPAENASPQDLEAISNIFGGGELLES